MLKALHLFGCYRKADAADPEVYAAAVAAILAEYPIEVVDYVCDPRTGLPRTCKWLPTIAEIVEACETRIEFATLMAQRVGNLRRLAKQKRAVICNPASSDYAKGEARKWLDERSQMIEQNGI